MIHEYGMAAAIRDCGRRLDFSFPKVKISRHFLDHFCRYSSGMSNEGVNQRMFAQQIGNSRYASGVAVYRFDRLGAENLFSIAAGDAQAFFDISVRLEQCQRAGLGPKCDALPKLTKLRVVNFLFQLRLTSEDNLEELRRSSLQIGQEANFLEHFVRQILSFINNQDDAIPALILLSNH